MRFVFSRSFDSMPKRVASIWELLKKFDVVHDAAASQ